jgi:hypothetical protein
MSGLRPDFARRRFLAGAAASGGALGAPVSALAAAPDELLATPTGGRLVLLYDERLVDRAGMRRLEREGTTCLALGGDPVRLWRGGAAALLTARSTRLVGMTRWADLLMVRGLAAESGRRLKYEKLDRTTGVFTWLIA